MRAAGGVCSAFRVLGAHMFVLVECKQEGRMINSKQSNWGRRWREKIDVFSRLN